MPLTALNAEQLSAATAPLGHNLIIASAGTGKTSTIVGRIGHLLSQGVQAEEILLLTFTNKAAQEMAEKILTTLKNKKYMTKTPTEFLERFKSWDKVVESEIKILRKVL